MKAINAKRFAQMMRDMGRISSQVSSRVAKELNEEIQSNFDKGVDPFGRRWRKLAKSTIEKGRHPPPLTGFSKQGRHSVVAEAMKGAGVRITVGVLYMIYHQFGGKSHLAGHRKNKSFGRDLDRSSGRERPPRRSFLPQGREMPKRWLSIFDRAYQDAMMRVWRG